MAKIPQLSHVDGVQGSSEQRPSRTISTASKQRKQLTQQSASSTSSVTTSGRKQDGAVRKLRVYIGMSGGVDSSVTAALLKQQGYAVTGVYMKNWTKDIPGFPCPWKEDFQDAKRVAVQLGIDFKVFDFEKEYKQKVVDYMIAEYQEGRTPNPDIMCNQEVKFKLFLETALEDGADFIATGHYARVANKKSRTQNSTEPKTSREEVGLLKAVDSNKDQTYFLYRVTEEALQKTLFPLGEYTKPEVRELAKKFGLATATKKESMGICFVGKVGIKEFLQQYVQTKPGDIVDANGKVIGRHEGAIFFTIGQRHGLDVGGGLPYYVVGKDMQKNEVYVTTDLADKKLWNKEIILTNCHWINAIQRPTLDSILFVRTRHRGPLIKCHFRFIQGWSLDGKKGVILELEDEVRALTPGQSAVIYKDDLVLGGGIIC